MAYGSKRSIILVALASIPLLVGCASQRGANAAPQQPDPWVATPDQQAYQRAFEAGYNAGQQQAYAESSPVDGAYDPPAPSAPAQPETVYVTQSSRSQPTQELPQLAGSEQLSTGEQVTVVYYVHEYADPVQSYPRVHWAGRWYYNVDGVFVWWDPYYAAWCSYWGPPVALVAVWNHHYPRVAYAWGTGYYGWGWYWGGVAASGFHAYAVMPAWYVAYHHHHHGYAPPAHHPVAHHGHHGHQGGRPSHARPERGPNPHSGGPSNPPERGPSEKGANVGAAGDLAANEPAPPRGPRRQVDGNKGKGKRGVARQPGEAPARGLAPGAAADGDQSPSKVARQPKSKPRKPPKRAPQSKPERARSAGTVASKGPQRGSTDNVPVQRAPITREWLERDARAQATPHRPRTDRRPAATNPSVRSVSPPTSRPAYAPRRATAPAASTPVRAAPRREAVTLPATPAPSRATPPRTTPRTSTTYSRPARTTRSPARSAPSRSRTSSPASKSSAPSRSSNTRSSSRSSSSKTPSRSSSSRSRSPSPSRSSSSRSPSRRSGSRGSTSKSPSRSSSGKSSSSRGPRRR